MTCGDTTSEHFPDCVVLPAYDTTTTQGRIDWLLQRRQGVGSSDCSAVLGLSKYSTAFSVWLDKRGDVPLDTGGGSEAMEWGSLLEPVIRTKLAERLDRRIITSPALRHRGRPWQQWNPDGILLDPVDGPIPVEIKNTSQYLAQEWADDQTPDHAELQSQHAMAVCGAPYCWVAGLIGGNRMVYRRVERDDELIAHILREEARFWQHVLDGTPPPVTERESLAVLLGAAGVADADSLVLEEESAADEVRAWLHQYTQASVDEKQAQARKAEARNNLVWTAAGHTQIVDVNGETVLCRLQRGVFAAKRFIDEEPDIAPNYMKKIEVVDNQAVKNDLPELFRRFQSVSVRGPKTTTSKEN